MVGTLRSAHSTALETASNPLRANTNFASHFKAIWAVQIAHQK
jgi:hypothetical protein